MRRARLFLPSLAFVAAGLSGCALQSAPPPIMQGGWLTYSGNHVIVNATCGAAPILLTGNHTTVTLTGNCTQVLLSGNHNDVDVSMAPGGRFEITGHSNDVWWHPSALGTRPTLLIHGDDDAFHTGHPS